MADEVFMSIPDVQKISSDFKTFGEVLNGIAKALEAVSAMMKASAWISFGATEAIATYLDRIKPNFTNAASKMQELSSDITSAINAYQNGDLSGSKHFVG